MLIQENADSKEMVNFIRTIEPHIKIVWIANSREEALDGFEQASPEFVFLGQ